MVRMWNRQLWGWVYLDPVRKQFHSFGRCSINKDPVFSHALTLNQPWIYFGGKGFLKSSKCMSFWANLEHEMRALINLSFCLEKSWSTFKIWDINWNIQCSSHHHTFLGKPYNEIQSQSTNFIFRNSCSMTGVSSTMIAGENSINFINLTHCSVNLTICTCVCLS